MNLNSFKRYNLIRYTGESKFSIIDIIQRKRTSYHSLKDIMKMNSDYFIINYTGKFIDNEISQGILVIEFEFSTFEELRKEYMEYLI